MLFKCEYIFLVNTLTSSCASIIDTPIPGCTEPNVEGNQEFVASLCYVPTVTGITASATETINGLRLDYEKCLS